MSLLQLSHLTVAVDGTTVCRDVTLTLNPGETHILLGPNGSGKSSLLNAIMGIGPCTVTSGTITLDNKDITTASVTERASSGIGMAMQHPPQLPGVTVAKLAHAMNAATSLNDAAAALRLSDLQHRDVNCGFSGGEIKRWEVMKLLLQQPRVCLFDEPESGVDLEHVAVVGNAINHLMEDPERAALIITHTGFILDHLTPTKAHLMVGGRIVESGDAHDMFNRIRASGYPDEQGA